MLKDLKVIFMGTPSFGAKALKYLIENTNVVLVVTQPDKEVGRKRELTPCIIKKIALENNIEVHQPSKLKEDFKKIEELKPDIIITAAYGQILKPEVLDIPKFGCINLHGSILPKYRGAAPIQWALIDGEDETGVTLMYMDKGMDTGDIIDVKKIKISDEDNFSTLYEKLSEVGLRILTENLKLISESKNNRIKQDETKQTHARMLTREDEFINFSDTCKNVYNKIRGIYPNGYIKVDGNILKILKCSYIIKKEKKPSIIEKINKDTMHITTTNGVISLEVVKPFGKKEMDIKSYLNGIDKKKLENMEINQI